MGLVRLITRLDFFKASPPFISFANELLGCPFYKLFVGNFNGITRLILENVTQPIVIANTHVNMMGILYKQACYSWDKAF